MSLRRRKGIVPFLSPSLSLLPPLHLAEKWPPALSQLGANWMPASSVNRSFTDLIPKRADTKRATVQLACMHTCLTFGPRSEERRGVVRGKLRDTVNINKRSQEAVSRSVDFIGPSRLSSFRFFFQQPAITPRRSFTRAPLPFLVHGIPSRVTARIWKCTLGRIFLLSFFLSFRLQFEALTALRRVAKRSIPPPHSSIPSVDYSI